MKYASALLLGTITAIVLLGAAIIFVPSGTCNWATHGIDECRHS